MASALLSFLYFALVIGALAKELYRSSEFVDNYSITWGQDHVSFLEKGRVVQLSLDKSSG